MFIEKAVVRSVEEIAEGIFLLSAHSPSIASIAKAGQFCNIKVSETDFPLLRRPFSIFNIKGDFLFFVFDTHGLGTKILSAKRKNDTLDILGPLGNGFDLTGDYQTAVIVAGGLGVAPFSFLIRSLQDDKEMVSYLGARTKKKIVNLGLKNVSMATDDGSYGFKGNVVDLLKKETLELSKKKFRIFACGPNPMLKELQSLCIKNNYDCQISIECAMACGFGICQGCPIESYEDKNYLLVCKDGPVFNANAVKL